MKRLAAALAVAAVLATGAACGGGGGGGGDGDGDAGPNGGLGGTTPGELVGVITKVSGSGDEIDGISLRTDEGQTHVITLDPAIDYGFPLSLLEDYQRAGQHVNCSVERRDNRLYATLILAS